MPKSGIDLTLISTVDTRNLSSAFQVAAQQFYDDPKNRDRFAHWKKKRDAHSPITND